MQNVVFELTDKRAIKQTEGRHPLVGLSSRGLCEGISPGQRIPGQPFSITCPYTHALYRHHWNSNKRYKQRFSRHHLSLHPSMRAIPSSLVLVTINTSLYLTANNKLSNFRKKLHSSNEKELQLECETFWQQIASAAQAVKQAWPSRPAQIFKLPAKILSSENAFFHAF